MKKIKTKPNVASQDDTESQDQLQVETGTEAQAQGVDPAITESDVQCESKDPTGAEDTVESLREKIAALEDTLLRTKADFLNTQRRQEKSRQDAVRFANADLMRSLLGVLDDFERALEAVKGADNTDAVVEGVRLVYENFKKELTNQGLEQIDAADQQFDPHIHEAVLQQPVRDVEPNMVIQQVAKGFRLHDRVLRPAKVIVSKAEEPAVVDKADPPDQLSKKPDIGMDA